MRLLRRVWSSEETRSHSRYTDADPHHTCTMKHLISLILSILVSAQLHAGEADVIKVDVRQGIPGEYHFDVTVRHDDHGWDHYANKWEVVAADGTVLGTRVLHHPHDNEQPFTRSLSGVKVPAGIDSVTLRAYDSQHEAGGKTVTVKLPR